MTVMNRLLCAAETTALPYLRNSKHVLHYRHSFVSNVTHEEKGGGKKTLSLRYLLHVNAVKNEERKFPLKFQPSLKSLTQKLIFFFSKIK